jgi:hypothetical protein
MFGNIIKNLLKPINLKQLTIQFGYLKRIFIISTLVTLSGVSSLLFINAKIRIENWAAHSNTYSANSSFNQHLLKLDSQTLQKITTDANFAEEQAIKIVTEKGTSVFPTEGYGITGTIVLDEVASVQNMARINLAHQRGDIPTAGQPWSDSAFQQMGHEMNSPVKTFPYVNRADNRTPWEYPQEGSLPNPNNPAGTPLQQVHDSGGGNGVSTSLETPEKLFSLGYGAAHITSVPTGANITGEIVRSIQTNSPNPPAPIEYTRYYSQGRNIPGIEIGNLATKAGLKEVVVQKIPSEQLFFQEVKTTQDWTAAGSSTVNGQTVYNWVPEGKQNVASVSDWIPHKEFLPGGSQSQKPNFFGKSDSENDLSLDSEYKVASVTIESGHSNGGANEAVQLFLPDETIVLGAPAALNAGLNALRVGASFGSQAGIVSINLLGKTNLIGLAVTGGYYAGSKIGTHIYAKLNNENRANLVNSLSPLFSGVSRLQNAIEKATKGDNKNSEFTSASNTKVNTDELPFKTADGTKVIPLGSLAAAASKTTGESNSAKAEVAGLQAEIFATKTNINQRLSNQNVSKKYGDTTDKMIDDLAAKISDLNNKQNAAGIKNGGNAITNITQLKNNAKDAKNKADQSASTAAANDFQAAVEAVVQATVEAQEAGVATAQAQADKARFESQQSLAKANQAAKVEYDAEVEDACINAFTQVGENRQQGEQRYAGFGGTPAAVAPLLNMMAGMAYFSGIGQFWQNSVKAAADKYNAAIGNNITNSNAALSTAITNIASSAGQNVVVNSLGQVMTTMDLGSSSTPNLGSTTQDIDSYFSEIAFTFATGKTMTQFEVDTWSQIPVKEGILINSAGTEIY